MELQLKTEQDANLPGLFLSHDHHLSSLALSLFAPDDEPKCIKLSTTTNLSALSTTSATSLASYEYGKKQGMGRSYFSMEQWQELKLQALIFKHIISGATIPPQLLHLLITNKSFSLSSLSSPYYQHQLPLQHYRPACMQSRGKGAMDPEPGRCRRTDGKKWRCSKEAVAGHKYCDRHVYRGRNRSRKPVEIPTQKPTAKPNSALSIFSSATCDNDNGSEGLFKSNIKSPIAAEPWTFIGGRSTSFPLSRPSHSFDLLHFNQRSAESITETKGLFRIHKDSSGVDRSDSQTRRHSFDDWARAIQEPRNTINNASLGTSLSISVPGIDPKSDVSLKLSTGIRCDHESGCGKGNGERERSQLHWGTTWGGNQMGGPLAEAFGHLRRL
ncbi:Growth-regulating factor [Heracleum sosnowskyi]|uniref:Growth-regulating factor n=1 Tax=Heracleum sosnowskyi TaxID=360622 RepID=A0AAD8JMP9_9APIA|nr:Growth-regulating factor [Heracleum sosnowskyi]